MVTVVMKSILDVKSGILTISVLVKWIKTNDKNIYDILNSDQSNFLKLTFG